MKRIAALCPSLAITNGGVSKSGTNKSEHSIIYTGKAPPEALPQEAPQRGERGMRPEPIRVEPDSPEDKLDPLSRIDYGKVHTIQHNIKVQSFGQVHPRCLNSLVHQFRNCWNEQPELRDPRTAAVGKIQTASTASVHPQQEAEPSQRRDSRSAKSGTSAGSQGRRSNTDVQSDSRSTTEVWAAQRQAAIARLVQLGWSSHQGPTSPC